MNKIELVDGTPEITVLFQDVAFRLLNRVHFWAKALPGWLLLALFVLTLLG